MNKRGIGPLVIGIIVVAVLVVGGVSYFAFSGGNSECKKICKENDFTNGIEKTNQCGQGETAVDKCCCSNVIGGGDSSGGSSGSGGTGSGGSGGSSSGSNGGSISSSWCSSSKGTIETFKGRQACHIPFYVSYGGDPFFSGYDQYTYIIDEDYWVVYPKGYNYEAHFVNGKVTELNCLSENSQSLAMCEQFKTTYCSTCP